MERPLTDWERGVIERLASVEIDGGVSAQETLPHLVVTGGCLCGCATFNVRDARTPKQRRRKSRTSAVPVADTPTRDIARCLGHFSNGVAGVGAGAVGFALWLGPDGGSSCVDVDPTEGALPDPSTIVVSSAGVSQ